MFFPRLLTQHTSEAMHVQGNDGQSNRSGKSLSTFRPNTGERFLCSEIFIIASFRQV